MSILHRAVSFRLSNSGKWLTCFDNRTAYISPIATSAVLFNKKVCPFCRERWVFHSPTQGMDLLAFTIERQRFFAIIITETKRLTYNCNKCNRTQLFSDGDNKICSSCLSSPLVFKIFSSYLTSLLSWIFSRRVGTPQPFKDYDASQQESWAATWW